MGTALEGSLHVSGILLVDSMLTRTPSCSTSLPPGNSHHNKGKGGSMAILITVLHLDAKHLQIYVQKNHSMVIISVAQVQIALVTLSVKRVTRTC